MAKGMEKNPEGGERCFKCYRLRMEEAARLAQKDNYDYFTTTLSISPLKNAEKINEIGEELAGIYKVPHLPSDFKKKNGYKRSIGIIMNTIFTGKTTVVVRFQRRTGRKMKIKQNSEVQLFDFSLEW